VDGLLAAPLAPLFKLDLALDELLVFGRPIVNALAVGAGEADQAVLRHNANNYNPYRAAKQHPLWLCRRNECLPVPGCYRANFSVGRAAKAVFDYTTHKARLSYV
jgi:hypothetical protein